MADGDPDATDATDGTDRDDATSATDVFDRVTHATRVDVLHELASAHADDPTDPWLQYSELRDAVGVRDTGNFNYHLDELDDFVVKTDAGYRLSRTGMELVATIAAGVLDTDWTWGPVDAPGTCPFCDDDVVLHYTDGGLRLTCGTDDHAMALSAPPSLLETHPESEVVDKIAFLTHQWSETTRQGICADCHGRLTGHLEHGGSQPDHYHYLAHCHRCGYQHGVPLGLHCLTHPTVTHFYHDHGIDARTTPWWTLDWTTPGTETTHQTDPLELQVDVHCDNETLTLTIDDHGTTTNTTRTTTHTD